MYTTFISIINIHINIIVINVIIIVVIIIIIIIIIISSSSSIIIINIVIIFIIILIIIIIMFIIIIIIIIIIISSSSSSTVESAIGLGDSCAEAVQWWCGIWDQQLEIVWIEVVQLFTLLDLCGSSLRRGHANTICIVPMLTDDPRRESYCAN